MEALSLEKASTSPLTGDWMTMDAALNWVSSASSAW